MATVFARLKVPSPDGSGAIDDHGVHAFLVPLRDAAGNTAAGVEIRDCGYKVRAASQPSRRTNEGCLPVGRLSGEQSIHAIVPMAFCLPRVHMLQI